MVNMKGLYLFVNKVGYNGLRKIEACLGRAVGMRKTLRDMALRPFELHFELTNLCNANCVFCAYQHQKRPHMFMSDAVFEKALADYVAEGGGSVFFTPIVGDALVDPKCLDRIRRARSFPTIDRIKLITNGILIDRFGADALVTSGITHLVFSIAGFDEEMYERVYRSKQYRRVFRNILDVLDANERHGRPLAVTIGLRPDRPLGEVVSTADFQVIQRYPVVFDFNWAYTTIRGLIKRSDLPETMRLRVPPPKTEPCVNMYNGPIILADGKVLACSCVAAMDAVEDLCIGDILQDSLGDIWRSERTHELRASFNTESLNPSCRACDTYRNLDLYATSEGRERARINRLRCMGREVHRRSNTKQSGMSVGG